MSGQYEKTVADIYSLNIDDTQEIAQMLHRLPRKQKSIVLGAVIALANTTRTVSKSSLSTKPILWRDLTEE
jgi:hypothetical protein